MTMTSPLVTVVLTAYNQERFIKEAITSVLWQTYQNIQILIYDNCSTDKTYEIIKEIAAEDESITVVRNESNLGLCKAFNTGLQLAEGKYIIDLAGDDIMHPTRIEKQVQAFELLSENFAVVFTNARYINEAGGFMNYHYFTDQAGHALGIVPSGDVYKKVLERYFICTPTMMMRTSILVEMNGYDEALVVEDFDFWVRTAVKYGYFYLDEILTDKRVVEDSLGSQVVNSGTRILDAYYAVCNKAYDLNRDQIEFDLLAQRIRTFIRKCWYANEFELALKFRKLLNFIENPGWVTEAIVLMCKLHVPINALYRFYMKNIQKNATYRKDFAF